jgi:hypothetical protein
MRRIIREPLLHFLLISMALFAAYAVISPAGLSQSSKVIAVDREQLITFLQYRNRSFERDSFERLLANMDRADFDRLVSQYVAEEAMFREAKNMRLDENDYVTRMRLVQQLEYLTKATVSSDYQASRTDIEAYFREHREEYYVEPTLTFAHVFVSKQGRSAEGVQDKLAELGARLEEEAAGFAQASRYGGRFLYHVNYVEKGFGHLASHFGPEMASTLLTLKADEQAWQGPLESAHGFHYVLLPRRTAGYQPPLEEVYAQVAEDVYQLEMAKRYEQAVDDIVRRYSVLEAPLAMLLPEVLR